MTRTRQAGPRAALTGAACGAAATGVMSLVMLGGRLLGSGGRLGPAVVTERVLGRAGTVPESSAARAAVDTVAHFAFGAFLGAVYSLAGPPLLRTVPAAGGGPAPLRGAGFALAVWGATYGSTLPALRLFPAPSADLPGRQARLVVGHLVYGATLGGLCARRCEEEPWS